MDAGSFAYGQEDFTNAYVGTDGKTNSVTRAVRSVFFVRPSFIVVHDQAQTASTGVKKYFNLNFNAPTLARNSDIFSATTGSTRLFMRSLIPSDPQPVIVPPGTSGPAPGGGTYQLLGTNYQVMTTGKKADSFLHLFQISDSSAGQMAASSYVASTNQAAQGVELDAGARRWVILAATQDPVLSASELIYSVPIACPCSHVIADLPPSTAFNLGASDENGVLHFDTDDPGTRTVSLNRK